MKHLLPVETNYHPGYSKKMQYFYQPVNHIFKRGFFLEIFERAKVNPIPQVKDTSNTCNFRLVVFAPVLSSLFERLIITKYLLSI